MARLTPTDFFTPVTGVIAKVKPDFVARSGQQELAEKILDLIGSDQHLLAEAPTGFGKSFAALVPAIIAAVYDGHRIVISTETIALQDQYVTKDLPMLKKACAASGINFKFAVAKGRSNYICKAKLDELPEMGSQSRFGKWASDQQLPQHTGDKATIPFDIDPEEWRAVGADDDCERKGCPFYGEGAKGLSDCFVYAAKRSFLDAHIVVTNHTLMLIDAAFGQGILLGPYQLLIIDEAHTIPEQAQKVWGLELGPSTVSSTVKLADKMLRRSHIDHFVGSGFLAEYQTLERQMFQPLNIYVKKGSMSLSKLPTSLLEQSKAAASELQDKLRNERAALSAIKQTSPQQAEVVKAAAAKLTTLIQGLGGIYGENIDEEYKDNWIVFLEAKRHHRSGNTYCIIHLKPIDVAPLVKTRLLSNGTNVAMMSATLQVNNSFVFIRKEMGLAKDEVIEFVGATPFNFKKQAIGYFPTDLPDPDAADYKERLTKRVRTIINRRGGQALVLFTSTQLMTEVFESLEGRLNHPAYCQGQASKNVLIERFKNEIDSCLFATRSFFTGVDIPGEALSNVILTKAPFRVPSDPLFSAKCTRIKDRGGNDFSDYSMPLMLMDVRQAFGRLIRTSEDKGLFAFLDSRANKKQYGDTIKRSLPAIPLVDVVE